jgi:hypothetical protein
MLQIGFDMRIMEFLASHRSPALTSIFLFASALGDVQLYRKARSAFGREQHADI